MSFKNKPCAYCGNTDVEITKGHVIPSCVYSDSYPEPNERITVPECTDCQQIWKKEDQEFRNMMVSIWHPEEILDDNRYQAMMRSGHRRLAAFWNKRVKSLSLPGRWLMYPVKDEGCNLILRRIIRGLAHYENIETSIKDERVKVDVAATPIPDGLLDGITCRTHGDGFFSYWYSTLTEEGDGVSSAWLLKFGEYLHFAGVILPDAR